jgi:hypothetical protein
MKGSGHTSITRDTLPESLLSGLGALVLTEKTKEILCLNPFYVGIWRWLKSFLAYALLLTVTRLSSSNPR